MKNYIFAFKTFFSGNANKVIVTVVLLFINIFMAYCFVGSDATTLTMLVSALLVSPIYFAAFLFISYEFYGQIFKTNTKELLTEKTTYKLYMSFFGVLMTIDALVFLGIYIWDYALYLKEDINHPMYLVRLIFTLVLYYVLPEVLAIVISVLLSSKKEW